MSWNSNIEWTDDSLNLFRAVHRDTGRKGWHCEKVDTCCKNCYAERINQGFFNLGTKEKYTKASRGKVDLYLDEELLAKIPRMRKGRKIFINSMTDIFAPFYPLEWIFRTFDMMREANQHWFQVLTKRERFMATVVHLWLYERKLKMVPENIVLMCTTGTQMSFLERMKYLSQIPALRGVSVEPMLESVEIAAYASSLNWVICGGETGPKRRMMELLWPIMLMHNCRFYGIPFFFKNMNGARPGSTPIPEKLQVRQFPEYIGKILTKKG